MNLELASLVNLAIREIEHPLRRPEKRQLVDKEGEMGVGLSERN